MKAMKKTLCAITLVIVGLVLTSGANAMVTKQSTAGDNGISLLISTPLKYIKHDNSMGKLGGAQVTSSTYDDFHPSVAASPSGIFYAQAESSTDGSAWQPTLYSSDATGATWQAEVSFTYPSAQYTALDSNSVGTYGTFGAPAETSSQVIFFQAEDTSNSGVWDWSSNGFSNLFNVDIAAYNDPNANATAIGWNLALTGSYGSDDGVPMVLYQEFGPNNYGLMSRSSKNGYNHAVNSVDKKQLLTYNVYDRADGTNLFVRVVNVGKWNYNSAQGYYSHQDKKSATISETEFLVKYPSVAVSNNTAIIVAQKITGSQNDIICYASKTIYANFTRIMVAESADNETYPSVVMTGDKSAVVTYFKNDVLYNKTTTDGGLTWSAEGKVSDNQARAEYRGHDICNKLGGTYGVWEDIRNTNVDIFFDKLTEGQKIPIIKIGDITAGVGKVSAVIENTGTAVATNVEWSITLNGGLIILGKSSSGTVASIEASASATVNSKFIFGFGKPTITVHAKCAEGSEDTKTVGGSVFLFIVKIAA
jgi:hypothetical protein